MLILAWGRGRWAVSQKGTMIRTSGGCTVQRLGIRSDRVFGRKLERERERERAKKRNEGGGGGEKRKRFPANPHETPHDISLFPLFFVPLFHAILVTRSETLVTQATGFHVFPLQFLAESFLALVFSRLVLLNTLL